MKSFQSLILSKKPHAEPEGNKLLNVFRNVVSSVLEGMGIIKY